MLYYHKYTYELKEIANELINAWRQADNPKINDWILLPDKPSEDAIWNNGSWIIPPATIPETVSARQVRLWLIRNGFSLAQVDAAINSIQDTITRESVRVEWEYAPYIERNHPMLLPLASALGLSDEQIDQAFIEANNI